MSWKIDSILRLKVRSALSSGTLAEDRELRNAEIAGASSGSIELGNLNVMVDVSSVLEGVGGNCAVVIISEPAEPDPAQCL